MKRFAGLALLALVAACTPAAPPANGPEAVVKAIYKPLVESKGEKGMPLDEMPLSEELKTLVTKAEEAGKGEPVFDGDFAGNCQDCTGFGDLKIALRKDAAMAAERAGVEATFKLFGKEQRSVTWDMIETTEGWRVSNILSEGIDLRKIAQEAIDGAASRAADDAVECLAYLDLAAAAAKAAKPPKDAAQLEAASAAWRKKAEGLMTADELAQYYASSVAVFDDLKPEDLGPLADACVAKVPQ